MGWFWHWYRSYRILILDFWETGSLDREARGERLKIGDTGLLVLGVLDSLVAEQGF